MIRDRLEELKMLQSAEKKKTHYFRVFHKNNNSDASSAKNKHLIKIYKSTELIGQWIRKIEKNSLEVKTYLGQLNDKTFKDTEEKIRSLFHSNTLLSREVSLQLKEVVNELKENKLELTIRRIKFTQYSLLRSRFESAYQENNDLFEGYEEIRRQRIKKKVAAKGRLQITSDEIDIVFKDGVDVEILNGNISLETDETKRILSDVETRQREVLQIEKTMQEVHDLFVQMTIFVNNQQEINDIIEKHVEASAKDVKMTVTELKKAENRKTKSLKKKIYVLTTATTTFAAAVLVLVLAV